MSFIIDQNLCVGCGACFSNCPNRAIIKRGDDYLVSQLCSDCGTCINLCPMEAIRQGETRADFDNKKIAKAVKKIFSLKKGIVAMKYVGKPPQGVTVEEGPQFWCSICGDIFEGKGEPVFFTGGASACGGSGMVGVGAPKATKDEFKAAMDAFVVGEGKLLATNDLISKGREVFPLFPKIYEGVVIGSLEQVKMPDIIIFPANGHQMCMIATAYGFDTGNVVSGYSGAPACIMTIAIPFVDNKPVFSTGDWGGRTRSRMEDNEMFVCLPYRLVPGIIKNAGRTVYAHGSEFT
jgi:uncharacterized protein (DUF169 family)/NAD-dependent dihydropyrimidine dehydrogenase PreA subunit